MAPEPESSPFLTISEVMQVLKFRARNSVRNMVRDKTLRVIYPRPRAPRFLGSEVMALAESREKPKQEPPPPTESGFEAMQALLRGRRGA